jgi:hypothetical protein
MLAGRSSAGVEDSEASQIRDGIEFVASSAARMCSAVQGEAIGIDERGAGLVLTNLGAQVDRSAEGEPILASSGANHE